MSRKYTRKNKRYRRKRGGSDLESGPEPSQTYMDAVPPDPNRLQRMDQQIVSESFKPISNEEAASIFEGPSPEEKIHKETKMMANEDPLNKDPFEREELTIFGQDNRGGKRTKKRRRNKKKSSRRRRYRKR